MTPDVSLRFCSECGETYPSNDIHVHVPMSREMVEAILAGCETEEERDHMRQKIHHTREN